MVFSSATFLFVFLPISMAAYYLLSEKYRNIFLVLLSFFFYSWGEPRNIYLLILTIVVNFCLAEVIDYCNKKDWNALSKVAMIMAALYNLGVLYVFKYLNFTIENLNILISKNFEIRNIALPIGISFFIFKSMSYIFDVYSEKIASEKNIINFALYISFFPQIMAGPITRYCDFKPSILDRNISVDRFYEGAIRFMIGFSKKVLLSDQLISAVSLIYENNGYSAPVAWIGAIAYTLEIYYDFSGYSDMAIGLGIMLGFETKENFNLPYIATSIQDFWRRWHISLSSWFRDYVYFPLGGSRCSRGKIYFNITIVFLLTGLWHGASWTFIAWGLFYVVFLVVERAGFKDVLQKLPIVVQHAYALTVIVIGWVFFRAENLQAAIRYIRNMFLINNRSFTDLVRVLDNQLVVCLLLGIIFSSVVSEWIRNILMKKIWLYNICIVVVFLIAIGYMWGSGFSPFLYFKF